MKYFKKFFNKRKKEMEDESGAVAIIVAVAMVILLAFTALGMDFGHAYIENAKLQTACDAAARAAALVYDPSKTGCDKTNNLAEVRKEARRIMKANGYTIQDSDVVIYEPDKTVTVTKAASIETTFAKIINIDKMNTQKSATVAVTGSVEKTVSKKYALFSGSQTDPIPLTGSMHIVGGDVHTNSCIDMKNTSSSLDVNENLTSRLPSINTNNANQFDVKTNSQHEATVVNKVLPMPDYDQAIKNRLPAEATYTTYNTLEQYVASHSWYITENIKVKHVSNTKNAEGDYIYSQQVMIAAGNSIIITGDGSGANDVLSGQITVSDKASIYSKEGGLKFTNYTILYAGYIIAKKDISFTGSGINAADNHSTAALYSEEGSIEILPNGKTSNYYGLVYAPNGSFIIPDQYSVAMCGSVVANVVGTSGSGSLSIKPSEATDNSEFEPAAGTSIGIEGSAGGSGTGNIKLIK